MTSKELLSRVLADNFLAASMMSDETPGASEVKEFVELHIEDFQCQVSDYISDLLNG